MKIMSKYSNELYALFRIIFGIVFLLHGLQKFGAFGGASVPFYSLFWFAGVVEVIAGPLIILGLFTRCVAFITAVEMVVALLYVHLPGGINPLTNGGEPALLFLGAFLLMIGYGGGGAWNLEKALLGKEIC